MIDKDFIREWIEALRSGDYQQGKGFLRGVANKFCCLGVACDIHDPSGWKWNVEPPFWAYGEDESLFPLALRVKTGLSNFGSNLAMSDIIERYDSQTAAYGARSLVTCNDSLELPFSDIANILEQYLDTLE